MSNFLREGDATVKKYAKLCQDKKKKARKGPHHEMYNQSKSCRF